MNKFIKFVMQEIDFGDPMFLSSSSGHEEKIKKKRKDESVLAHDSNDVAIGVAVASSYIASSTTESISTSCDTSSFSSCDF